MDNEYVEANMNIFNKILPKSISFTMTGDAITFNSTPQNNKVELQAIVHISDYSMRNIDPIELDKYIKHELAMQLATQIVEEDLIEIKVNDDPSIDGKDIKANLKIIQE